MPADSASEIVKFTLSIPRESCTNAKAKYRGPSSSVVPPDPSVHFYHWYHLVHETLLDSFLFPQRDKLARLGAF